MMKKILPCSIVLLLLIACNSNQPDQDPSIRVAPSTTQTDSLGQQTTTANPAIAPVQPPVVPNQPVQTAPATTAPTTTAGLNPAHGQPNHRCDIAVGAPLNSPVQATQPATQTIQPVQTIQSAKPSTTIPVGGSTAKLNPPHGEPGHDCKIPVGQPLN